MRIPLEALPLYDAARRPIENQGAKPVGDSARLDSALPQALANLPRLADADERDARDKRRQRSGDKNDGENDRQDDRRKAEQPTLIDTRVGPRRKNATYPAIDIKV